VKAIRRSSEILELNALVSFCTTRIMKIRFRDKWDMNNQQGSYIKAFYRGKGGQYLRTSRLRKRIRRRYA
jgi:hypothetical protein